MARSPARRSRLLDQMTRHRRPGLAVNRLGSNLNTMFKLAKVIRFSHLPSLPRRAPLPWRGRFFRSPRRFNKRWIRIDSRQHLGFRLQIIVLALPGHFFLMRPEIAHAL
jgi:hypothetical protein